MMNNTVKIGDCDCCTESVNVELFPITGGMMACSSCRDKQVAASKAVIESAHVIPTTKNEIFVTNTVAMNDVYVAIKNNPEIPDTDKEVAYTRECLSRFTEYTKLVFEAREKLTALQNDQTKWKMEGQISIGKLRGDIRSRLGQEYKVFDINYQPTSPTRRERTSRPTAPRKNKIKFNKGELYAAAAKYGVSAAQVQMLLSSNDKFVTPLEAAKHLATLYGLETANQD